MKGMNKEEVCLLITGCVNPADDIYGLSLADADERKRQYIDSLRYYIEKTKFKKIVFCENSMEEEDKDLKLRALIKNKEFEWITFQGDTKRINKQGKGYGEGEIIEYALNYSRVLSTCRCFIKITGRLIIKNINWLLFLSNTNCYFDVRANWIDTKCYLANIDMYMKHFKDAYKKVDDRNGFFLEHSFSDVYNKSPNLYNKIPFILNFIGQSGSTGIMYQDKKNRIYYLSLVRFVKNFL